MSTENARGPIRLMIAVPSTDYVHVEFVKSLTALTNRLTKDGIYHEVKIRSGSLVYLARDNLVLDAINGQFTHVLWLDSDMVFDDDILYKLTAHKKAFVTGLAYTRRPPFESCVFTSIEPFVRPDDIPDDIFEIEACGFACVFIDVRIMSRVLMKYFECFDPIPSFGEDIAFCIRARKLGFHIWCEPSAKVGHIGSVIVTPDNALKLRNNIT